MCAQDISSSMSPSERQQLLVSHEYHSSLTTLVQLLSPFAPHIASQLWEGEYRDKRCMVLRGEEIMEEDTVHARR